MTVFRRRSRPSRLVPTQQVASAPGRGPRGFTLRTALAYLGLYTALLASALVTVPLRIGEVDPQGKESSLGLVAGVGSLVAVIANPLFGRLSDRTTSRLGRRRPWLVGGVLGGTAGLAIIAVVPSVPGILVGWCLAQLAFNATLSSLAATIPDQVPVRERGRVSGAVGFSQLIAIPLGAGVAALFASPTARFLIPALVATLLVILFAVTLRDRPAPPGQPRLTRKEFFGSFWTDPRAHPDFGWMWLTRFLVFLAAFSPVPYLAFFLSDRMHVSQQALAGTLALLTVANYGVGAVTSALSGWLSDRTGRRKPFVVAAMLVLATGMVMLAAAGSLAAVLAAQVVLGFASGLYFGVDLALSTQVLPSAATDAKDLGVMNVATVLPQSIGPAAAPLLIALGSGHNYTALYVASAVCAIAAAAAVTRIRGPR
jgi:MFS family permease